MGYEIKSLFRVETTRLLWLTGVLFAMIITFQFIELPYGNVWSSLFPSHEVPAFAPESENVANVTRVNGLMNSTGVHVVPNVTANGTVVNGVKEIDMSNDVVARNNVSLNVSSGFDSVSGISNQSSTENLDQRNSSSVESGVSPENEIIHGNVTEGNTTLISENIGHFNVGIGSPSPAPSPNDLSTDVDLGRNTDANIQNPVISTNTTSSSSVEKNQTASLAGDEKEKPVKVEEVLNKTGNTPLTSAPQVKKETEMPSSAVITIAEMNNLLHQSYVSYHSVTPRWSSAVDQELLDARSQIENAPIIMKDVELYAPLYRNVSMFKRSYELMEEKLKVYVYREGERPILHVPFLSGIYASEGWFMRQMETNTQFVTKNPRKAHLFYLPFSSRMLEETLYVQNSHSQTNLVQFLKDYVDLIASKHPFWNRTEGADHFLVACHDWAPSETRRSYMGNCIRALCNADMKEGYVFGKDISLPETYVRYSKTPLKNLGGNSASKRSILAFYAGNMHGYLRPILLQHWENKDPDMKIFGQMPKPKGKKNKMDYVQHMKSSKYCICPRGYEVNSPRVVEAIFYECVPVIISDNFVPPFFEVLNWESFAVFVEEKDVPNLKNILVSIPQKRYLQLQLRLKKVQKHFLWHSRPEKFDIFHMILHSVWYNRVFQMK